MQRFQRGFILTESAIRWVTRNQAIGILSIRPVPIGTGQDLSWSQSEVRIWCHRFVLLQRHCPLDRVRVHVTDNKTLLRRGGHHPVALSWGIRVVCVEQAHPEKQEEGVETAHLETAHLETAHLENLVGRRCVEKEEYLQKDRMRSGECHRKSARQVALMAAQENVEDGASQNLAQQPSWENGEKAQKLPSPSSFRPPGLLQ